VREHELLSKAKAGDREALARLLHDAYPIVYGYLVKLTLDRYLAEDLTQRAMIRALERLTTFHGESKLSTWLVKISTNLYRDELRKEKRRRGAEEMLPQSTEQDPHLRSEILSALSQLTAQMRAPILLKYYCDLSYSEMAELLGVPVGTVRSRLHYGHERLKKILEGDGEGDR
jgi:RNA polymerase sigma-70 factor (ECF subfamily)